MLLVDDFKVAGGHDVIDDATHFRRFCIPEALLVDVAIGVEVRIALMPARQAAIEKLTDAATVTCHSRGRSRARPAVVARAVSSGRHSVRLHELAPETESPLYIHGIGKPQT